MKKSVTQWIGLALGLLLACAGFCCFCFSIRASDVICSGASLALILLGLAAMAMAGDADRG